jgi:hypothetical protein
MAENTDRPTGANAYSIYVQRDVEATQVNWSEIAKNLTQGAEAIRDSREAKKQAINDATQKALEDLSKIAGTDAQSLGKLLLNGSQFSKKTLMENTELLRAGLLDPNDYQLIMQQQLDSYKNLSEYVKGADAKYKIAMERLAAGEDGNAIASDLEISWNEGTFGFGDLKNKRLITNPRNGELVLVTMVDDGTGNLVLPDPDKRPDLYQNTAYINIRSDFKLDRRNTNTLADGIVDNLATVITSSVGAYSAIGGGGVVTSIEDFRQMFDNKEMQNYLSLENDDGSGMTYDQFMSDQVSAITGDASDLNSMNAAQVLSGAGYKFVQSAEEAKAKGITKYIIYKNVDGRPEVELTEGQMTEARNIARRAIESRIDLKIKQTQPDTGEQERAETSTEAGIKDRDASRANLYATVDNLVSGDTNEASSAGTTLANIYNSKRGDRPEITGQIQRIYVNGKPQFVVPFADRTMTIEGQFENGDPKTVRDIIREIYDVVNPYKDDVTVAERAFDKEGEIPKPDYSSVAEIEGTAQSPLAFLENKLDERLDSGRNATGPEIEGALSSAISSVMPQVMFDNFEVTVSATDADAGSKGSDGKINGGQVVITFKDNKGRVTKKTITNTNDLTTSQLWAKTQAVMNKAIEEYNKNEKPL